MYFFPEFQLNMDVLTIFGAIIFVCIITGEIISRLKIVPRISGYIILGFILGPNVLGIISKPMLTQVEILTDISLGLIAFSIGRHLDFTWLKHDKGLLWTGISEFILTTIVVSSFICFLGWPFISALLAGIIAATTSSAVILVIARDLSSEGPVTKRSIALTSMNNLLALIAFAFLLPFTDHQASGILVILSYATYRLLGSLLLGFVFFKLLEIVAHFIIGKQKEQQFILLISIIILAIVIAKFLNLFGMLVLISIGMAARNYDYRYALMEIDFGWLTHLLFIPLFFITGCYLNFIGLIEAPLLVLTFIALRLACQATSVFLFKNQSLLTKNQALAIVFALTPLTGFAIDVTLKVLDYNPEIGQPLLVIISAAIALLGILGPIATQAVFKTTGESF